MTPTDKPAYTHRAKVIVVGDAAVGKTSIVIRYVKGVFSPSYMITLGVNFFVQDIIIGEKKLRMQIWDTAGQERFGPIRKKYYIGARGALIVFDQSNPESFEHLDFWLDEVKRSCGDIPIVLVSNKADLTSIVNREDVQNFASTHNLTYAETSAKTGMNTVKPFFLLAPMLIERLDAQIDEVSSKYSYSIF